MELVYGGTAMSAVADAIRSLCERNDLYTRKGDAQEGPWTLSSVYSRSTGPIVRLTREGSSCEVDWKDVILQPKPAPQAAGNGAAEEEIAGHA